MLAKLAAFLKKIQIWKLILISVLLSEIFTAALNSILSILWYGRLDYDLFQIGSIDAFLVALGTSFIVLTIVVEIRRLEMRSEEITKASLKEKEVLLRELNHRTKNNMQIISSILRLQAASLGQENVQQIISETQNRIRTMSLIHEKLQSTENLTRINIKEYISELARYLLESYEKQPGLITLNMDIDMMYLPIDMVTPCGLIINELMSNSLKYAFPGNRPGEINILFQQVGENGIEFTFSDNGIGLPENFKGQKSLGLRLVRRIATKQLGGKLDILSDNGAKFKIVFQSR